MTENGEFLPRLRQSPDGPVWPSVPENAAARVLALLFQFDRTERLSPDALLERQFAQLGRLYAHACATAPYYAERWRDWGVEPGRRLARESWRRIPVLTRREAQSRARALRSASPPASHGRVSETLTSGSTGAPLRVVRTQLTQLFWSAFTLRHHLWHRRDLSGRLAAIKTTTAPAPYPEGARSPSWGEAAGLVFETGPGALLDVMTKAHLQAEWLDRRNPDYLLTHPSNLAALLAERPRGPPRLRQVMTVSEALSPAVREACEAAWGTSVADIYSSEEAGYLALQCPERGRYHVQAEGALVEVLRADGAPCGPGEVGQVVVTPLHNFAMPLLRYALGDLAEVAEPCGCGRGLPALSRILGRVRGTIRLPNGERHYPDFGGLMEGFEAIRQFQIVRTGTDRLEARLVAEAPLSEQETAALADRLRGRFQHPFEVRYVYVDEIAREPNGKFEDFRSELPEDREWAR